MPLIEAEIPHTEMVRLTKTHVCGECGGELRVAWGGCFGYEGHILRCDDLTHSTIKRNRNNKLEVLRMETTALQAMSRNEMLKRIGQARFPKDLTEAERQVIATVALEYGLDPLMNELMVYQGQPYVRIDGRYRKAQDTGEFDGINTRPATEEERKARNAKEDDHLYCAEVWRKGASHPFVGWGKVTQKEIDKAIEQAKAHNRQWDALPIVKDPDRQAEKRAEAQGLRKAFSLPLPSWEEKEEALVEETKEELGTIEGEVVKKSSFSIDMEWLKESLRAIKWSEDTTKSYLSQYGVSIEGTLEDVLGRLTREQAEEFTNEINSRLEQVQLHLVYD